MRKRDRLKHKLRQIMGRSAGPTAGPTPTPVSSPASPAPQPPQSPTPEPVVEAVPSAELVDSVSNSVGGPDLMEAPDPKGAEALDAVSSSEEDEAKEAEMARKAAKHFERTRVAMLKFIVDQGDEASLADMHDLSERRYFIGHKRFSTLMEGLVEEDLIDFDHATGIASITGAGKDYLA